MSLTGAMAVPDGKDILRGRIVKLSPNAVDKTLSIDGANADAKATGDALKTKVNTSDIVDNLNSAVSDKPLSAKQGYVLNNSVNANAASIISTNQRVTMLQNSIGDTNSNIENKLDLAGGSMQGSLNMDGKALYGLRTPVNPTDAANKKFVEEFVEDQLEEVLPVPDITEEDNGKFLTVQNGVAMWTAMDTWTGGSY